MPTPDEVKTLRAKAKFRLLSAHFFTGDKWLPGDKEMETVGPERGTIVGAGTEHEVRWPTLEMEPLNEQATDWLELERERLAANDASMNPVEDIDMIDEQYVPGLNVRRREPAEDGAPRK
jgi:hypothetical protein